MSDTHTAAAVESRIVYVLELDPNDLPAEARDRVGTGALYAIHDADNGSVLAVAADRDLAFSLARRNDLEPVSAH